ncbi:hypothetical protein JWV37_09620 [Sulfurospirillum sp. T05]|uniref:Uncharacterized protein n=1 Tax=Sulfurospirillum tamanense TaxID=2813362 RepID=A0ABS2WTX7_9BACT|nr:hypothetical protein [Sulfurospirillum tamanensis]MBN2965038.1 hypothetical protein [Sulfurospirillum tamanensis]
MAETLKCSIAQCKQRASEVEKMNFDELRAMNAKCEACGNWLLKETEVANQTYHKVSNLWAVKYNQNLMKKRM